MSTTATCTRGAPYTVPPTMRRLLLPAVLAALALSAAPALAKNGVKPISPKKGDTVPAGKRPTFKMNITGDHNGVFVHVCKSRRKDDDGMICHDEVIGQGEEEDGSRFELKAPFFDFPEFWLNKPGTYYWQAYRSACNAASTTARPRGRSSSSRSHDVTPPARADRLLGLELRRLARPGLPAGLPPRRWLAHYATLFDTVEVNSTFYRLAAPGRRSRAGSRRRRRTSCSPSRRAATSRT